MLYIYGSEVEHLPLMGPAGSSRRKAQRVLHHTQTQGLALFLAAGAQANHSTFLNDVESKQM